MSGRCSPIRSTRVGDGKRRSAARPLAPARQEKDRTMSLATLYGETQETYLALIRTFPLRPLRSEADLDEATTILDALVVKDTLTAAEADYLAVLSDLVEQYEAEAHPIHPASDAELLEHLLDARGLTPPQVAQETGLDTATLTAVLAGTQPLTHAQIDLLARSFQVSPSVFAVRA
jgi:HTH-type transcriptional regulator / antitoxin HigA